MNTMFGRFLVRFVAAFVLIIIVLTFFFIHLGVTQYFTMLKRVDCQVMAAFECAVRNTQSSIHDATGTSDVNNIQTQNPKYYKYYYTDFTNLTHTSEYTNYLNILNAKSEFGDAVTLLRDEDTQKFIGLIPMDLALPYVHLNDNAVNGVIAPGLNTEMQNILKTTLEVSADDFNLINVDLDSLTVNYNEDFDSQNECLNFTTSKADIFEKLGPVYLDDTNTGQIVDNQEIIPYYDLKVNVTFNATMNIPVLKVIDPSGRLTNTGEFSKDYTFRYSLLN